MKKKKKSNWQFNKNRLGDVSNTWRNKTRILDKIESLIVFYYTRN
jgi:hypothetical protein